MMREERAADGLSAVAFAFQVCARAQIQDDFLPVSGS